MCRWSNLGVFCKSTIIERRFGITYQTGKYFKINEKWVINKMLNYFSSSTVFGVIRLSYSECNHNVTEIARFSKGDFGNVHCNTESVDSNTDWTQVWHQRLKLVARSWNDTKLCRSYKSLLSFDESRR